MRPGRLPCAMLAGLVAVSAGWGQALRSGPDAWPVFRGDGGLSGVSSVSLQPPLALRWTWRDADHLLTSPVIADGRVFVGSTAGRVICLEAATGKIVWSRAVGSAVEAPPVVDGAALYVSTSDGVIMRLQAASGRPRWSFAAGGRIAGSANIHRRGSLATVVVGSYDGSLYGLDAGTGERRWSFTTGNFINGAPSVAGNLVVFGGCDARLHLLSAIDGREVSSVDTGSYIPGSPAIVEGRAFVGNFANVLLCANLADGAPAWTYSSDQQGSSFFSSPAVNTDVVVVGCRDGRIHCVEARTGARRWAWDAGGEVDSSPVIAGDFVLAGSGDGRLVLLSLSRGTESWSFDLGDPLRGSPAVTKGLVVVSSEGGMLRAFEE